MYEPYRNAYAFLICMAISSGVVAAELVDPTRPFGGVSLSPRGEVASVKRGIPRLQAVFSGAGGYTALIDGAHVGVGEEVASYRVEQIERSSVRLSRQGTAVVLRIGDVDDVKQASGERR